MEFGKVQQEFMILSGLDDQECMKYYGLINFCIEDINRKKNQKVSESSEDLLSQLAAVEAYYRYLLAKECSADTIRVLDVSVQRNLKSELERAQLLKKELNLMAREFLKDDQFVFSAI